MLCLHHIFIVNWLLRRIHPFIKTIDTVFTLNFGKCQGVFRPNRDANSYCFSSQARLKEMYRMAKS